MRVTRDRELAKKLEAICGDIDELCLDGTVSLGEQRAWIAVKRAIKLVINELELPGPSGDRPALSPLT